MSELSIREQAIYLYALRLLTGIGPKKVSIIARTVPHLQTIPNLTLEELKGMLNIWLAQKLHASLAMEWKKFFPIAQKVIDDHLDKGVFPLPITSNEYPILLKQIEDAPAILYVKGDRSVLKDTHAVAIVGTREPTAYGHETARLIAEYYVRHGYVIVSGLAKGIDTAAHLGTIAASGKTIAVFATPLDKVYPAENRKLAEQIVKEAGVIVSELPFGTASWKGAFVERDRIQSGLSLGVIPVQTGIEGGTMHTVRFAQTQKRLLFCPVPAEEEKQALQYEGIWWLLRQKKAQHFRAHRPEEYEPLLELLEIQRKMLLDRIEVTTQQLGLVEQVTEPQPAPPSQQPAAEETVQQELTLTAQLPEVTTSKQKRRTTQKPKNGQKKTKKITEMQNSTSRLF